MRSCPLSLINVHFYNFHLSRVLPGQFIQNWFKGPAVPSPGGRELNESGSGEPHYLIRKGAVGDIDWSIRIKDAEVESRFTSPAHSLSASRTRHPVLGATLGTPNDKVIVHISLLCRIV